MSKRFWRRWDEVMNLKSLTWRLAHSKPSINVTSKTAPPSSIESRRVRERVRELWQRWSLANFCHLPPAKEKASGVWGQGGGQVSGSHSFFQVNADTSRPPWWTLLLLGTSLQWLLEKFLERFQNVLDQFKEKLWARKRIVEGHEGKKKDNVPVLMIFIF